MRKIIRLIALLISFSALTEFGFAAITIGETQINVTCYGGNDGTINITPNGGVLPYVYVWNDGNINQNRTNLVAGNYDVTVTDNIGATAALAIVIIEAPRFIVGVSATGENCGGQNIGTITLNVSGATPGYTYLWNDGPTTQNRVNLTAAVYYVTITDSKLCTTVDSGNVTQPPGIGISATFGLATCGASNGSINLTVQYGTAPYTYLWNDGSVLQNRTGLAIGPYTVTATDANGCSSSATEVLGSLPGSMTINTTSTEPVCSGGSDGTINITSIIGSVGPYSYLWSNGTTANNLTGLTVGSYTVTVTSGTGCTSSVAINIAQPTPINIQLTVIPLTCFGSNNGAINSSVSGGISPYSYSWSGGMHVGDVVMLQSINYVLTVTDGAGCSATAGAFVPQPFQLTATATPSPLACSGGPTGSVLTTVTGGTPVYTYWWGAGVTSPNRINVNSGNYNVTVTDGNGCTVAASANIPAYTPMVLSTTQVNNVCFGGSTGSIDLTVINGLNPYSFSWSTGTGAQNISALANGTYTVTVTDGHACTASTAATITSPLFALAINSTIVGPDCNGANDGSISINVSNGNIPYTYNWGGGITSQNRVNLIAGTYNLTATDNSGCTVTSSFNVTQPTPVNITSTQTNITCFAGSDGSVNLNVTGGSAPYSYRWSDGPTVQNRNNVTAGTYTVTVSDNHLCTATASMVITQPAQIIVSPVVANATCNGLNNGSISITVTGGTGADTYNWGGGVTTQNRTNLGPGTYVVTVTDNSNCSISSSSTLTQPTGLAVVLTVAGVSCNGGTDGGIVTSTTGGTPPYTYNWGGGITTPNRTSIGAGTYTVSVTDNSGCTGTNSATVSEPAVLTATATAINVSCNGGNNGGANLAVTGGVVGYTYLWSTGSSAQNLSGVAVGVYPVTVTDAHLCTVSASASVIQPVQINIVVTSVQNTGCANSNNGSINITVTGGTGAYTYLWSNNSTNQNLTGVGAGTYVVTVADANLCTMSGFATVTQPAAIVINTTQINETCFNGNNGQINSVASGGSGTYAYNWSNGAITANITNLVAATYILTVSDVSNCSTSVAVNITQPANIVVTAIPVNVSCNGGNNGSVNLNVSGGTGAYSFAWNTGAVTQQINNLAPNNYSVTVTDANACTATQSAVITAPAATTLTATHTDYACAATEGTINLIPVGTAPFTYNWAGGVTTQNRTNLAAGTYNVTLTDANLCTATGSVVIAALPQLVPSLVKTDVTCFGGNNGAINLTVNGGTQPYIYRWNNNATSQNISNLVASQYGIVVTDANNCTASATASVVQPSKIQMAPVVTEVQCFALSNGAVQMNVAGGTPAYTFRWSNNAATQNISGLAAGSYQLTVTDANLCTAVSANIIVSQPVQIAVSSTVLPIGCAGQTDGAVQLSVTGGTGPYSFLWSNAAASKDVYGLSVGNYSVTVFDHNGCTTSQTYSVGSAPPIQLTGNVHNVSCAGMTNGNIVLSISGGTPGYSYFWNTDTALNLDHLAEGTYIVTVNDALGCSAQFSFNITADYQLTLQAGPPATIKPGQFALITVSANVDHDNVYTWAPSTSLSCTNCLSTEASPRETTSYTVYVTDSNGCKASAEVLVQVNTVYNVFVPNAFSPNGDGNNDEFQIFGDIGTINYLQLTIFNRWGELVFETGDSNFKWDGNYKGQPAPQGVYIYVMQTVFSDGSKQDFKGSVTLLR